MVAESFDGAVSLSRVVPLAYLLGALGLKSSSTAGCEQDMLEDGR